MDAQTFIEFGARGSELVAPLAPALVAVEGSEGRTIVARRYDAQVIHYDGTDSALHAVRSSRYDFGQAQEVGVPLRTHKVVVCNVKF